DRFERPTEVDPGLRTTRTYLFDGGCATYELDFESGAGAELLFDVEQALGFTPRERLGDHVRDFNGLELCGAVARCVSWAGAGPARPPRAGSAGRGTPWRRHAAWWWRRPGCWRCATA